MAKSSPLAQVERHLGQMIGIAKDLGKQSALMTNTISRQLRIKLLSRSVERLLPGRNRSKTYKCMLFMGQHDMDG
jgi:hypothetical protein